MRLRTTHTATVYGDQEIGTNAVGQAQTEPTQPIIELQCRFRPQGTGWTREGREPRIDRSPEIVTAARGRHPGTGEQLKTGEVVTEGQRVEIDGVESDFHVMSVDPHFGNSGQPDRYTIELEGFGDG